MKIIRLSILSKSQDYSMHNSYFFKQAAPNRRAAYFVKVIKIRFSAGFIENQ